MNAEQRADRVAAFLVGLYAWLTAVLFGATLLDIVYARQAGAAAQLGQTADFLLLLTGVTAVAALPALFLTWPLPAARNLLAASFLLLALGLLTPVLLPAVPAPYGTALRIVESALVALPACLGFYRVVGA